MSALPVDHVRTRSLSYRKKVDVSDFVSIDQSGSRPLSLFNGHPLYGKLHSTLMKCARMCLLHHRTTHHLSIKRSVLLLLSDALRAGFSYMQLDGKLEFRSFVVEEVLGKKAYLAHPPLILPFIFNVMSLLAVQGGKVRKRAHVGV